MNSIEEVFEEMEKSREKANKSIRANQSNIRYLHAIEEALKYLIRNSK